MFKKRNLVIFWIPAALLLMALVYYVLVPGFDIEESPIFVQSAYYKILTETGAIDLKPTSKFMKKTHRATRIRASDDETPYTFEYTKENVPTLEKDSRRCQACHGSMRQKKDGESIYPIHEIMMTARFINFHCTDCHKSVDLGERDPSRATIRIDRTQCTRCHEGDQDTEPAELMNVKTRRPNEVQSRYLISNHGIDKKSAKQWIKGHAKVAADTGVNKCWRCHQKGSEFDFCDDCHGDEVPEIEAEKE